MDNRPLWPPSRRWIGSSVAAPRTAISSTTCQVTSRSFASGRSRAISWIRGRQTSASFFRTSPTMVGFEVAPTAPRAIAYSSSARAHESFQYSVGVVRAIRASGLSAGSAAGCIMAPIHEPLVIGIEREAPLPNRTGHHVEVVAVIPGGHPDRMVATGHEHDVTVHGRQRFVQRSVARVDPLEREALRPSEPVVVQLLEERLTWPGFGVLP